MNPTPGPRGFTLIEVLISIVLIAIGCLALVNVQTSTMRGGALADTLTVASFLAESQAELLRVLPFDAVAPVIAQLKPEKLTREGEKCPAERTSGCYQRTTSLLEKAPTSRSETVTIEITWQGMDKEHRLVYQTVISDYGF